MSEQQQTIEQLQQRYSKFRDQKIKVQTQRAEAQKRLSQLKKQAVESFGTDDIDALCKKLETMKRENEEQRKTYQLELDKIASELAEVQAEYKTHQIDD